jgi:hypothetical protein
MAFLRLQTFVADLSVGGKVSPRVRRGVLGDAAATSTGLRHCS